MQNRGYKHKAGHFPKNRIQESGARSQLSPEFRLLDSGFCPTRISHLKLVPQNRYPGRIVSQNRSLLRNLLKDLVKQPD